MDDCVKPVDHVQIRLAARVAVAQLVLLPPLELVWVVLLDFGVRHPVADSREELVEVGPGPRPHLDPRLLPALDVVVGVAQRDDGVADVPRRLARPPHRRSPEPRADFGARGAEDALVVDYDVAVHEFGECLCVGVALCGQARVAANLGGRVVYGLAVSREVEDVRLQMEVHQEVDKFGRHRPSNIVDDALPAVDHLDKGPRPLGAQSRLGVDALVRLLVDANPTPKVRHGRVGAHALVVGRPHIARTNVALDERLIRAERLDHDHLALQRLELVEDVLPLGERRVRPVEDGDAAVVLRVDPVHEVAERGVRAEPSGLSALCVVGFEPRRGVVVAGHAAAVVADVEDAHGGIVKEGKVPLDSTRDVRLPPGR
mmetsp:Transcript_9974/g.32922  ORF Transcript_9974/g.32922 Transcript_9974/m.32922 type:complete len:372 (+) Transcript_9974:326-1441(+)